MPIAAGLEQALHKGKSIGCSTIQIFTRSPSQWLARRLEPERVMAFREARAHTGIDPVIVHDSYLINLASPDSGLRERSMTAFFEELRRAQALGASCVVTHMGSHLEQGEAAGLKRLAASLRRLLSRARPCGVAIALETTAGQGTSLGYRLEHLEIILGLVGGHESLSVCLDTCHLFAAGYDFRKEQDYLRLVDRIEATIGTNRVAVIHMNDSARPCGSRVDRHAHLGEGHIGREGFRHWVRDERWRGLPMIIETPESERMHKINLRWLRKLAGDNVQDHN